MTDNKEDTTKPKKLTPEEQKANLKNKIKKTEEKKKESYAKSLATRELLERDYNEDTLIVSFYTSPSTNRSILTRRPNQEEFIKILELSIQASKFEGKVDANSLDAMKNIYSDLHEMAADLSVDESLDKEFWAKHMSFSALQNFIGEIIITSQKGYVSEEDMKSFR